MIYVEWLRVRGILKWTAIVLLVLSALLAGLRFYFFNTDSNDALSFVHAIQNDAGSKVDRTTLPDGTLRTTIVNAGKQASMVIDDHGYQGKHIVIRETGQSAKRHKTVMMSDVSIVTSPDGNDTVTTIDTGRPESLAYHFAIAAFIALIVGTLLGAPFARENDGHLEITLTKPVARVSLALATIGIDVAGIVAAWLMASVFLLVAHVMFQAPHFTFGPNDVVIIVLGLVGNLAWYAMLCCATASMKRSYGVVLGLSWPVAILVVVLAKVNLGGSTIGQLVHLLAVPFSWIDPLTYLHFGPAMTVDGQPQGALAVVPGSELPMLAILALVYGAFAIFQWRRVEA